MRQRWFRVVLWIGSTTVGLVAGGFVLHFPGSFGIPAWDPAAMIFGALLGAITGLAVGVVQWAALTLGRSGGIRVLQWMAISIAVTHALGDGAPASIGIFGFATLAGLAVALSTVVTLGDRRLAVLAGVGWTAALILADIVSNRIGLPFEQTPVGWSTDHAFDGLVVGLIFGVLTAAGGVVERLSDAAVDRPGEGLRFA